MERERAKTPAEEEAEREILKALDVLDARREAARRPGNQTITANELTAFARL